MVLPMTDSNSAPGPAQPLDVLMIEDNAADAELCSRELRKAGFEPRVELVQTAQEFCARLSARPFHVILADYTLPAWNGLEALELLRQMDKDIPFILVTGTLRPEEAQHCFQKGATDFVLKDSLARVALAVRLALERRALREDHSRLESRCRESEQRWQRLAELSTEALLIVSRDEVVFANAAAAQLLGSSDAQALLKRNALELVHPDHRAAFQSQMERLTGAVEPSAFETCFLFAGAQSVPVKIAVTALTYREQPAVQLVVRSLGERQPVQDAVQSLAAFPQLNPNPVLEFSRDGTLTYFNEAAVQMARSVGRDHPSAVLPAEVASLVRTCLASGQKLSGIETAAGGRTFSWSFFPIPQNQVVHCYVTDITERQKLEAQLRHAQKLESIGRLAAGVAHDFNNVLTVIMGHGGLLRSDPSLNQPARDSVQQIARAAERAGKLTSQLLAFSRRNVMAPRVLDLNEVITSLSSLLARTLGEDISYDYQYGANLPPVSADRGMIEQVILNIAVNARDAMPRGGQIVISTGVSEVEPAYVERHAAEARPGRFVTLSISDSGLGMDNVTLGRIFEPFFTTKEFGKGTGLGLATVYGIVKQHQGWIEVQSQLGQGSTFKIYLPPASGPLAAGNNRPAGDTVPRGKETILLVEDEPAVRAIIKGSLEKYGYEVLEAGNGLEALAVWHPQHERVALLLTDMVMPVGVSGQELAEKLSAQKPALKVIYISGYSLQVAGRGFAVMEGVNFLQKPFDGARLAFAVRHCLDS